MGVGQIFELNPVCVAPDLEIVCPWDIQHAAQKKKRAELLADTRNFTIEQKIATLIASFFQPQP